MREYDVTIVSNVLPFGHPVPYDRATSTLAKREHSEREGWPSRDTLATLVRLVLTSQTCLYLVTPLNTILRSKYSSGYSRSILLVLTNRTRIVYITKSSKLRARQCLSWLRAYAVVPAVTRSILYKYTISQTHMLRLRHSFKPVCFTHPLCLLNSTCE